MLAKIANAAFIRVFLLTAILFSGSIKAFNQSPARRTLKGTVFSADNKPLSGASVVPKGSTTAGTITSDDGSFSINITEKETVLVITAVGYAVKEVPVTSETNYRVSMEATVSNLNEVIVVGYGTQKKVNLTGSVATVSSKDIENRPVTQASQAIAGLAPGIVVSQGSGQPGNNGADITIRGIGSFGAGGGPLVLVDGLATSINDVDPNNIASVTVLKDAASASIYGSRAANGVVLIETKRGKTGKLQTTYSGYAGWQKATNLPEFLPSWEYATLRNEANKNAGSSAAYSAADIEKFRNQSDPDNFPDVPHYKNLVTSGSGFQTSHNLSFMGGNEKNKYLFSVSYLKQEGIVTKNSYDRYNFMLNDDGKITDNLTLKVSLNGYTASQTSPRQYDGGMNSMINFALREGPVYAGRKSDGTYGYQDNYSPEAWLASNSFYSGSSKYFLGGGELAWQPFKGFTLSGKAGYNFWSGYSRDYAADFQFDANKYVGPNNLSVSSNQGTQVTLQSLATYTNTIRDHHFTVLAGVSEEKYNDWYMNGFRKDFPTALLYELNAGSATGMTNGGSASAWSMRSYFGRLNYSFKERYLFEANLRADGTSRFPAAGRWGYFPSFSAGWRISEESFIKHNVLWIDNLKLRASWGKLGNQNVGTYPYQNLVSLGQNYPFGGVLSSGAATTRLSNSEITWETTTTTNVGMDMTILKGKLGLTLDYFNKNTTGVLYTVATSSVLGLSTSPVNIGSVNNKGFEAALNYNESIGKFNFGVAPNFSYTRNRITSLANGLTENISSGLFVGQPIGVIYGFVADGLFVDQTDISKYPTQPYNAEPGFVRYKDISGPNGVPDGIVDATYDRKVIGNTVPKYTYGITLTASYKAFDFYMLAQGLGGYQKQIGSYAAFAFYNGGQIQRWQADNRWTTENPNANAEYPKLTSLNQGSGTIMTSTYWNRDASFLRVKSLQVGYTLPASITNKAKISRLRFYFSGQNLFSVNSFYKGWDPEMTMSTGDGSQFYPLTAVYTFGLNASF
ncbi:SusC/RagA family TonB-linked outer membrane protein [Filimonas effusa]|uniref:TonB-dependent receptor n=1 Tax=Filimonas effusa TaxID=2508721 RepID=A0A4Q1DAF7_9BACT|nr:TonB-dependent receptor [Filimonas effusa]RXK85533.1 TonB-dependent receptor [Filimonas effusa]